MTATHLHQLYGGIATPCNHTFLCHTRRLQPTVNHFCEYTCIINLISISSLSCTAITFEQKKYYPFSRTREPAHLYRAPSVTVTEVTGIQEVHKGAAQLHIAFVKGRMVDKLIAAQVRAGNVSQQVEPNLAQVRSRTVKTVPQPQVKVLAGGYLYQFWENSVSV